MHDLPDDLVAAFTDTQSLGPPSEDPHGHFRAHITKLQRTVASAGLLCPDTCACGGAAVNRMEQLRYDNTVRLHGASLACPCVVDGPIICAESLCVDCCSAVNPPAGCPIQD